MDALSKEMRCGMFTNSKGQILIGHDQDIQSDIQWIEYDQSDNSFVLIHEDGTVQDLGLNIDKKMQSNIVHGIDVTLVKVVDNKMLSSQNVTLVVKDY